MCRVVRRLAVELLPLHLGLRLVQARLDVAQLVAQGAQRGFERLLTPL